MKQPRRQTTASSPHGTSRHGVWGSSLRQPLVRWQGVALASMRSQDMGPRCKCSDSAPNSQPGDLLAVRLGLAEASTWAALRTPVRRQSETTWDCWMSPPEPLSLAGRCSPRMRWPGQTYDPSMQSDQTCRWNSPNDKVFTFECMIEAAVLSWVVRKSWPIVASTCPKCNRVLIQTWMLNARLKSIVI